MKDFETFEPELSMPRAVLPDFGQTVTTTVTAETAAALSSPDLAHLPNLVVLDPGVTMSIESRFAVGKPAPRLTTTIGRLVIDDPNIIGLEVTQVKPSVIDRMISFIKRRQDEHKISYRLTHAVAPYRPTFEGTTRN